MVDKAASVLEPCGMARDRRNGGVSSTSPAELATGDRCLLMEFSRQQYAAGF